MVLSDTVLISFLFIDYETAIDYEIAIECESEYERPGRQMDELAREFGRTHDENIRLQIEALSLRRAEIARGKKFLR